MKERERKTPPSSFDRGAFFMEFYWRVREKKKETKAKKKRRRERERSKKESLVFPSLRQITLLLLVLQPSQDAKASPPLSLSLSSLTHTLGLFRGEEGISSFKLEANTHNLSLSLSLCSKLRFQLSSVSVQLSCWCLCLVPMDYHQCVLFSY